MSKVTAKVVSAGGDALQEIGKQIKDKKISKGFKDVGKFSSGAGKDVVKVLGEVSPYVGKAGQFVGDTMMKSDKDYGGSLQPLHRSLFNKFQFSHNNHAAEVVGRMTKEHHHAIRSAARFIAKMPRTAEDMVMLHHRPTRDVGLHHFEKIGASTSESLARALKMDKTNELHKAVQSAAHSAYTAGGFEFNHARHHQHHGGSVWQGGGLDFDQIGKEFGKASVLAGKIGLAASPVVTLIAPEAGIPLAAVSGAAVGIGTAVNDAYK